jgi:hypothetical protein
VFPDFPFFGGKRNPTSVVEIESISNPLLIAKNIN